ncbi:hypothetical protein [Actinoplanes sp. NPDC026670]|uniref:VG15 protein n=1 Tax=Actinoplanes sp. NPDC026670 TaxID=3154700 RepID=UPI0033CD441E
MTTEQRQQEATQASVAYQLALTYIGVKTIQEALAMWGEVPTNLKAGQGAQWLAKAVSLIMTRRSRSRELAVAYFRLARALRTGRTIDDPLKPTPRVVTLDMLRAEFAALIAPEAGLEPAYRPGASAARIAAGELDDEDDEPAQRPQYDPPADGEDDDEIPVERLDGFTTELARQERDAEAEAEEYLEWLGLRNLLAKLDAVDDTRPAQEVDAARDEAHLHAGTRQAAEAERIVMDGARATTWAASDKDGRVKGYARVSTTGTPCGFCAMLISRGAVYKSAAGAQYSDGDAYHPNCHCIAVELFDEQQFAADPRTALNREYGQLWQDEIAKKYSGKDAVNAWRRLLRARAKASALAARSTTPALEATPRERQADQQRERERERVRVR